MPNVEVLREDLGKVAVYLTEKKGRAHVIEEISSICRNLSGLQLLRLLDCARALREKNGAERRQGDAIRL
jgi:hypothetical protein